MLQEVARVERAAAEAAAQDKLDIEQQADAAMAAAVSHSEVYTKVTVKDSSKVGIDSELH